jgi:hypothetical protein
MSTIAKPLDVAVAFHVGLNSGGPSKLAFTPGIGFAPSVTEGVVLETECSKMTLSIDGPTDHVSQRVTYMSAHLITRAKRARRSDDPWAYQREGQVADLKRRIPILKRLIADCDRLAADLDQEVRNEEDRVRIHDASNSAYSTYARATASRRDNLRRSEKELRDHLASAERVLLEFGEATFDV